MTSYDERVLRERHRAEIDAAVAAERARVRGVLAEIGRLTRTVGRAATGFPSPMFAADMRAIKELVEAELGVEFEVYT